MKILLDLLIESFDHFNLGSSNTLKRAFSLKRNKMGKRSRVLKTYDLDKTAANTASKFWFSGERDPETAHVVGLVQVDGESIALVYSDDGEDFSLAYDFSKVPKPLMKKMAGRDWCPPPKGRGFYTHEPAVVTKPGEPELPPVAAKTYMTSQRNYTWSHYYTAQSGPARYQSSSEGEHDSPVNAITQTNLNLFLDSLGKRSSAVGVRATLLIIGADFLSPDLHKVVNTGEMDIEAAVQVQELVDEKKTPLYFRKKRSGEKAISAFPKIVEVEKHPGPRDEKRIEKLDPHLKQHMNHVHQDYVKRSLRSNPVFKHYDFGRFIFTQEEGGFIVKPMRQEGK